MNTPHNLQLLVAAAQGFRDAWDALAALHVNLGISGDTDAHEQKRDTLEHAVEELAGETLETQDLSHVDLQGVIDLVHTAVDHEQQPA